MRGDPRRCRARTPHAALAAQRRQHALDVLAGAETVDAVIDAAAGIDAGVEAADLDLVEAAAAGADAEGAEHRMLGLQRLDGDDLGGPRQRRSAISSSSVVLQPWMGGRSRTARALLPPRDLPPPRDLRVLRCSPAAASRSGRRAESLFRAMANARPRTSRSMRAGCRRQANPRVPQRNAADRLKMRTFATSRRHGRALRPRSHDISS